MTPHGVGDEGSSLPVDGAAIANRQPRSEAENDREALIRKVAPALLGFEFGDRYPRAARRRAVATAAVDALGPMVPLARVEQLERELAEAHEWAESPDHPNWESGWAAGWKRGQNLAKESEVRAQRAEAALRDVTRKGSDAVDTGTMDYVTRLRDAADTCEQAASDLSYAGTEQQVEDFLHVARVLRGMAVQREPTGNGDTEASP